MTPEAATGKLQNLIVQAGEVSRRGRSSTEFTRWHRDVRVAIRVIFGDNSKHSDDFESIKYSLSIFSTGTPDSAFDDAFQRGMSRARATLESMKAEAEEYGIPNATIPVQEDSDSSVIDTIERICAKFHLVVRQLRRRHDSRPTLEVNDEYDVQDLLHALLRVHFDDIRAEEWNPSYAGASSRVDFLLKDEKVVLEVKKTRSGLQDRQVGEQLLIDRGRYEAHPDCQLLVCFVYDPEARIGNPLGLINDLERRTSGGLPVRIIISPR